MIRFLSIILAYILLAPIPLEAALSDEEKLAASKVLATPNDKSVKDNEVVTAKLASIDVTGVDSDLKKNIELHMPVTIPECKADRAEVKHFFTNVKKTSS